MGRPKGKRVEEFSLAAVAVHLESLLVVKGTLAPDCVGEEVEMLVKKMPRGKVVLLGDLWFHNQETVNKPNF